MSKFKLRNNIHLGVLSAMPEETGKILDNLKNVKVDKYGDLEIFTGEYYLKDDNKIYISTCFSGWGKVSSARAATRLISKKFINNNNNNIDFILFTGVAGSANENIKQWDIVISESLIQYDLDCRPIFDKFTIPALNRQEIYANKILSEKSRERIDHFLKNNINLPFRKVYKGLIGTGDKFISDREYLDNIKENIPKILAVEMEGCAVAQVAEQEKIPWLIMRVISDSANESAAQNFKDFLDIYQKFSWTIIEELVKYITYSL